MDKTNALKQSKGNFEGKMSISQESITDVKWWITSLPEAYNPINHGEVEVTMSTDASLTGWVACIHTTTTGENWTPDERANDINYLEILAVFLALQSFSSEVAGKHVKLLVDNTTAVFSVNNMGTCHSKANNTLVAKIWEWCIIHMLLTHQTQKHMQLMPFICHGECINFMLFLLSALFTKFFKK
jgi:hypothetical protein